MPDAEERIAIHLSPETHAALLVFIEGFEDPDTCLWNLLRWLKFKDLTYIKVQNIPRYYDAEKYRLTAEADRRHAATQDRTSLPDA